MQEFDPVNKPKHYAGGKYECIEVMEEEFGKEAVQNFCLLNAFKYLFRCEKKHETPLEDIKKAKWYLEKWIALNEKVTKEKFEEDYQRILDACGTLGEYLMSKNNDDSRQDGEGNSLSGMCICVKSSADFDAGGVYYYKNRVMYREKSDGIEDGRVMLADMDRYHSDGVYIPLNGEFIPLISFGGRVRDRVAYEWERGRRGIENLKITYQSEIDQYTVSYEMHKGFNDPFVYKFLGNDAYSLLHSDLGRGIIAPDGCVEKLKKNLRKEFGKEIFEKQR